MASLSIAGHLIKDTFSIPKGHFLKFEIRFVNGSFLMNENLTEGTLGESEERPVGRIEWSQRTFGRLCAKDKCGSLYGLAELEKKEKLIALTLEPKHKQWREAQKEFIHPLGGCARWQLRSTQPHEDEMSLPWMKGHLVRPSESYHE